MGRQTRQPFDRETEKDLKPLDLVTFDLWGPSHVQSAGGKIYLMIIIDGGTSYKYGVYLSDKSDATTIPAFKVFRAKAETITGRKICRIRTDRRPLGRSTVKPMVLLMSSWCPTLLHRMVWPNV